MCNLWNGFPVEALNFEGREAHVVFPASGTANGLQAVEIADCIRKRKNVFNAR